VDADERRMFERYEKALRMWSRRFNTAEIADYLKVPEYEVCRMIWHWREFSRVT